MFSIAVQHLNDVGKFLPGRATGSSTGNLKPVMTHYDIATSYTIHEGNGSAPMTVEVNFPSDDYAALDYTPVWEHHRFVEWTTKPPYDAEIEYLESSGTQYIDTGIYPADGLSFDLKAALMTNSSALTYSLFGGRNRMGGSDGQCSWWNTADFYFYGWGNNNDSGGRVTRNFTVGTQYAFHVDKTGITIDGTRQTTFTQQTAPTETDYPIYLFNSNNGGALGTRAGNFRVYGFTIKNNGVTIRDFVPVRVGSVGYLYDKVSEQLFGNAGTGEFVRGGDIKVVSGNSISPSDKIIYDVKDIYASWQSPTTVTFDATTNGGQMPSDWVAPDYYEGQPYGTLPKPTKDGETFLGWFTFDGTRVIESSTVTTGTLTARYAAITWGTTYSCTTTSTYKNTGIYSASRYSTSDPIVVDWGDGTNDVVYGDISQLAHTYEAASTYTVKISDNISTFCPSYNVSTWYGTTSQNQHTFKAVLTLSSKVAQLSSYAFYYCSTMTDAIIPSGATSIPDFCFYYCSRLRSSSVQLPSTITSIGYDAFDHCGASTFNSITIPASCTKISNQAFYYCYYLHPTFESGESQLSLGSYAFAYCGYYGSAFAIDLSSRKVTAIPTYCFYNCRYLKAISWPQGVTSIGGSAFYYCFYYLASTGTVEIPEGVVTFGTAVFRNCLYLTAVTLPSTLTNLSTYTFYYCTRLATINCNRATAPTASPTSFGNLATYYTGRSSYSAGTNRLYVPAGATGYDTGYWASVLLDSTKCGFTLEEMT